MESRPRRIVWTAVDDCAPDGGGALCRSALSRPDGSFSAIRCDRSERATVITDVVIILPLVLMMIAGMFMLGTRISDYMYLHQSTRELGMILSKIPFMYELGYSSEEDRTFLIDPRVPDSEGKKTSAEICITMVSNPTYKGCLTSAGNCACARIIAEWYAIEFMRRKLMLIEWPISVKVEFGARDLDPLKPSGLCFVNVATEAAHFKWAMVGGGTVATEAHVPYVSAPVPWNLIPCVGPHEE